ncbi:unnamed protein product [Urochloa humidicola]
MAVWSTRIQQFPGRYLLDEMLQCKNRMHDDELLNLIGNGLPVIHLMYSSGAPCSFQCFFIKKCTKADWQAVSLLDDLFHAIVGRPRLRSQERKLPAEL